MRFLRNALAFALLCIPVVAYALTTAFNITVTISALTPVFNCTGFATSGSATTGLCGVRFPGSAFGTTMQTLGAGNGSYIPSISGTTSILIPTNGDHYASNMNYELAAVNVGQFSSTFTFIPDGQNVSFILSNNTASSPAVNGNFTGGASCEGAFFQGYTGGQPGINNTLAIMLESYGGNIGGSSTFTYSSVQYYVPGQAAAGTTPSAIPPGQDPCNPASGGETLPGFTYVGTNKISTSPVPLNSPAGTLNTTTGHTYSATVSYDGSNLTISMFDVTAGGACPGAACFTNTWTGVNVPAIVGGTTAWVGLGGATGNPSVAPLIINTFSYSSN